MDQIQEIKDKLHYLKTYDKAYLVFGAGKHQYRLNPVLSESEVRSFEAAWQIKLPPDYREFILEVGNGGAGPGYGLYSLGMEEEDDITKGYAMAFPLTKDYVAEDAEEEFPCRHMVCEGCEYEKICPSSDYIEGENQAFYRYQMGSMAICFEGCTYYRRLVLNGPHAGEIWAESEGEGLKQTKHCFIEWYMQWLNQSVSSIQPLVEAVKNAIPFEDILSLENVGGSMLVFPHQKAQFVAAMLGIKAEDTGNSGKAQEEYVKRIQKEYNQIVR